MPLASLPVKNLTDQHLLAEHREIKRVPNYYKPGKVENVPAEFKLGTGSVRFFLDKGRFLLSRYKEIHEECLVRGFNVTDYSGSWNEWAKNKLTFNDYIPSDNDRQLLLERISIRISESEQTPRYYRKPIAKEDAIKLLRLPRPTVPLT